MPFRECGPAGTWPAVPLSPVAATNDADELADLVRRELAARADPVRATAMASYMKTDMAFYGVPKAGRAEVLRLVLRRYPIATAAEYVGAVEVLWGLPHREEKYLAIDVASNHRAHITFAHVGLYRRLIVEGAWWDLVDGVAANCVGRVLLRERPQMGPVLERWIDDDDMWIRRSALIAHLRHKGDTDAEQLLRHCLARAHEKEFFIRKAIGWALREYAKTDPEAVAAFALAHRGELSGLSLREATKHLEV
jgi:3-methyladenine DNA glycosylase AlkD